MSNLDAKLTYLRLKGEKRGPEAPTSGTFPRSLPDGTPRVSPSQVSLVLECGEKYRRKYKLAEPDPTGANAYYGTVFHAVMEDALRFGADVDEIVAHAHHVAKLAFQDADVKDKDKLGEPEAIELSVLAGQCVQWLKDWGINAIGTEETVTHYVQSRGERVAIMGRYDAYLHVHDKRVILDWKTSMRSPSIGPDGAPKAKRNHLHAALTYANALKAQGRRVDEAWVLYAVRQRSPKLQLARIPVTEAMRTWADNVSRGAIELIQLGAYAANPNSNLCSQAYCAYWDSCPASPSTFGGE